jgi:hypothetical protein
MVRWSRLVAITLAILACPALAGAQTARCARLTAELESIDRSGERDHARVERYRDAIDRQQVELQRSIDYAQSIGCDFEPGGQCGAINANIARMERNLSALQSQYDRVSSNFGDQQAGERERILAMLQDLGCDGTAPPPGRSRTAGLFEQLFGGEETEEAYALPPSALPEPDPDPADRSPVGGNLRTICVRTCDGYFFPISFSTHAANFAADEEACRRQCPAADVALYAYDTFSQTADDAVSARGGQPLKALPNAFRFRTAYDPSCTCGKAAPDAAQSKASAEEALKRLEEDDLASPPPPADAKPAPQRRTAASGAPSLPTTAGDTVVTTTPGGQKKKVRIIGPEFAPKL